MLGLKTQGLGLGNFRAGAARMGDAKGLPTLPQRWLSSNHDDNSSNNSVINNDNNNGNSKK